MYTLRLHTGRDPAEAIAPMEAELRRAFNRTSIVRRERFLMTERLAREVAEGKKSTTIRIDHRALEYPAADVLPVFAIGEGDSLAPAGCVRVRKVVYKRVRDLTEVDARRDGFATRCALMAALVGFYGELGEDEPVSVYEIVAVNPHGPVPAVAFRSRSRSLIGASTSARRNRQVA